MKVWDYEGPPWLRTARASFHFITKFFKGRSFKVRLGSTRDGCISYYYCIHLTSTVCITVYILLLLLVNEQSRKVKDVCPD